MCFSILCSFYGEKSPARDRESILTGHLQSCGRDRGWPDVTATADTLCAGTDPGEVKWVNFHPPPPPPFSEPPSFSLFLIPQILTSNTSTRLWFYDIITKIHPPFQNPGSAPDVVGMDAKPIVLMSNFPTFIVDYALRVIMPK